MSLLVARRSSIYKRKLGIWEISLCARQGESCWKSEVHSQIYHSCLSAFLLLLLLCQCIWCKITKGLPSGWFSDYTYVIPTASAFRMKTRKRTCSNHKRRSSGRSLIITTLYLHCPSAINNDMFLKPRGLNMIKRSLNFINVNRIYIWRVVRRDDFVSRCQMRLFVLWYGVWHLWHSYWHYVTLLTPSTVNDIWWVCTCNVDIILHV